MRKRKVVHKGCDIGVSVVCPFSLCGLNLYEKMDADIEFIARKGWRGITCRRCLKLKNKKGRQ